MGVLDGKRAIVTGAASGIGRASAALFAREGAQVVAVDIEKAALEANVAEIERAGGVACAHAADVAEEDAMRSVVERCVDRFGGVDVLFANAGTSGARLDLLQARFPILELEAKDWRAVLNVNLIGAFLGIKHAAPVMIEQGGGSIICTASVAGLRANAGPAPYSASKAGVVSLVQTAAWQLSGTGVRVNAICPGLIETGMTRPIFDLARARGSEGRIGQLNPLRRAGQPEEIAQAALFLAGDASSYLNGQAIAVDGGLSSGHPTTLPRA
ncbi:MAG: SDR family oxidoreductase [Deltaproteobacteria bacterium]|nr:MAG: SDR family oxidoreductase [Deltaproteobacteria bacterium]